MELVTIEQLNPGDRVVVQTDEDSVDVFTVQKVEQDGYLVVFKENPTLEYCPEDPDNIVILS